MRLLAGVLAGVLVECELVGLIADPCVCVCVCVLVTGCKGAALSGLCFLLSPVCTWLPTVAALATVIVAGLDSEE